MAIEEFAGNINGHKIELICRGRVGPGRTLSGFMTGAKSLGR